MTVKIISIKGLIDQELIIGQQVLGGSVLHPLGGDEQYTENGTQVL